MYTDLLTVSEKRAKSDPDLFNKMSSIKIFHTGGAMCLPEMIIQLKKCFKNAKFLVSVAVSPHQILGCERNVKRDDVISDRLWYDGD